jgi:hypothetical protein
MPDETILSAIAGHEPSIYGLRWGGQTRFAVLDVDKNSKYRSDLELAKLQERLAAVGLTATVYRSSDSGGWHLYIFFDEWADSGDTNQLLSTWLKAQGYEIRGGTLEVFPSGMGLRLPLQSGFAWLDDRGGLIRTREELTRDEALASFLCDLEENKRNWSEAKSRIRTELECIDRAKQRDAQAHEKAIDTEGFEGLWNYRLIPEKYQKGREYWQSGLTEAGQRHDAILAVEHYLWHGDEAAGVPALPAEHNDEPRYRLILAWLEAKHNGFCNHINRGNWRKVEQQIKRACKWRRPFGGVQVRTPYLITERSMERLIGRSKATGRTWTPEDFKKGNEGRELYARKKIREALQLLTDQGRRVTGRQLMRLTGCGYHTVRRHSDIWKISPVVALPRAAGDKNPFLDLDLIGAGGSAPGPEKEKEILDRPGVGDSGVLDAYKRSGLVELAPIDITPPLLLPGEKPTSEPPASSPSPSGCFARLDAGALVRRYFGRGSGAAGGLEQEQAGTTQAGVIAFFPSPCYSDATKGSINERRRVSAVMLSQSHFCPESIKIWTVSDATNFIILTTRQNRTRTGYRDKLVLICSGRKLPERPSSLATVHDRAAVFFILQTYRAGKFRSRAPPKAAWLLENGDDFSHYFFQDGRRQSLDLTTMTSVKVNHTGLIATNDAGSFDARD